MHRLPALSAMILCVLFCACISCTPSTQRPQQIEQSAIQDLAWFIEDLCHGTPRNLKELIRPHHSDQLAQVRAWIHSDDSDREHFPLHLRKRIDAWAILKSGIHTGHITSNSKSQLVLGSQSGTLEHSLYARCIQEENRNRLTVDQLVILHAPFPPQSPSAKQLLQALHHARISLDKKVVLP